MPGREKQSVDYKSDQPHLMGFQKTLNCRNRKKENAKKDQKKESDRLRYLKKTGEKVELLQEQIAQKIKQQNKIIKKKQQEVKNMRRKIKNLEKKNI